MTDTDLLSASSAILRKAKQLGVQLAGFANVEDLKVAPSFVFTRQLPEGSGVKGIFNGEEPFSGDVQWPEGVKSILAVGLEHPESRPEMDWWYGHVSPPGNTVLVDVVKALAEWIPTRYNIDVFHFSYLIERGGIFLKDAAVFAGLGCVGKNNMLITPEFGPRVRLRAMALSVAFPSAGPSRFDPCIRCNDLCRKACSHRAFDKPLYSAETCNLKFLPGRDGCYGCLACNVEMRKNSADAREQVFEGFPEPVKIVKYCRDCELSCPVGKAC